MPSLLEKVMNEINEKACSYYDTNNCFPDMKITFSPKVYYSCRNEAFQNSSSVFNTEVTTFAGYPFTVDNNMVRDYTVHIELKVIK